MIVKNALERKFEIGIVACNNKLNLRISHLQEFLTDTAMDHCNIMKLGFYDLQEQNLIWVITEIEVHINRIPVFGERVKVRTWPLKPRIIVSERNFEMMDKNNAMIGYALSSWCILDRDTRKPVKTMDMRSREPKYLEGKYKKSKFDFCDKSLLKVVGTEDVMLSDLDANNHMNNTKYIGKVLNTLNEKQYTNFLPKCVHMKYVKEVKLGTKLTILFYDAGNKWYAEIQDEGGATCFQTILKF